MNTLRVFAVLAAMSTCAVIANAQEVQPKDISVIESSISAQPDVFNGKATFILQIKAIVEGKTYWMVSGRAKDGLLELGSYKAVEHNQQRKVPYKFKKSFELIYPDGTKEVFSVTGESK
jgi:hypothetical protein